MRKTSLFHRRARRYQLIEPAGSLFHADLHVAELSGVQGFVKLFTVWQVRPELCAFGNEELLMSELAAASRLSVWSILQIMDTWWDASRVTLATEHAGGTSLAAAMQVAAEHQELLPIRGVLAALLEVARSLEHAHDPVNAGTPVVHGDLRPEHVLLAEDGGVKLGGFGFGRFLPAVSPGGQWCTYNGRCYQGPERLAGGPLDPRSDVYSLGAMLLEATTGVLPHGSAEHWELIERLRAGASPVPDEVELAPDLLQLVQRACHPDLNRRYPGMTELAADLHALLLSRCREDLDSTVAVEITQAVAPLLGQVVERPIPVLQTSPADPVTGDSRQGLPETPLVGREPVMRRIGQALADAAQGQGQVLLLQGDAGAGHTRLLAEVPLRVSSAQRKLAWVHAEAQPHERDQPYAAVLRLLASNIGLAPGSDLALLAQQADHLRAFGLDEQTLDAIRGVVGAAPPQPPDREAELLGQALVRVVTSLSWEQTTVVAWDGLHRTDQASLGCLQLLLDQVSTVPVVVLLTAVGGFDRCWGPRAPQLQELAPLPLDQCQALALGLVPGAQGVDQELLQTLTQHSGGNPLLLELLLGMAQQVGLVELTPDAQLRTASGQVGGLPGLDQVTQACLEALTAEEAEVAVAAALAGPALDLRVLSAATGVPRVAVRQALSLLAQQPRLLRRSHGHFTLAHPRLRAAMLGFQDSDQLAALGGRLARATLQRWDSASGELADHAADLLLGSGEAPRAMALLMGAAARQQALGEHDGAAERLGRALALCQAQQPPPADQELRLCLQTGRAALPSLSLDLGEQALQRAVELADSAADAASGAEARLLLCRLLARKGRLRAAKAWAIDAVPMAEGTGDRSLQAEVYGAIAETLQQLGEFGPDLGYIETALEIARELGQQRRLGEYLALAVMHAGGVGLYQQTTGYLRQARDIARSTADPQLSCQLLRAEGMLQLFQGQAGEALATNRQGLRLARQHGLLEQQIMLLHNIGDDHLALGQLSDALFYVTESRSLSGDARFDRLTEANEMFIGFLQATHLGDPSGLQRLQAAMESARRQGRNWNLTQGHQLMGRALLEQDDKVGAMEQLEEAVLSARKAGVKFFTDEARRLLAQAQQ